MILYIFILSRIKFRLKQINPPPPPPPPTISEDGQRPNDPTISEDGQRPNVPTISEDGQRPNDPTISEDGQYSHSPRPRSVDRTENTIIYFCCLWTFCLSLSVCLSVCLSVHSSSLLAAVALHSCLSECPVHPSSPQSLSLNTIMSVCLSIPLLSRSLSFRRPVCLIVSMYLNVLCERVFLLLFFSFFSSSFFLFLFNLLS